MPISGVNLTPCPTAVYASDPALPRRPQDSLPSCLLGFERTRLALASSYQLPIAPRTGLLPKVRRDRHSGLGRPIQFRSVGAGRRGHAGSGSVSGACVGPGPSFDRPPSLHTLRHQPVGRRCSRLHRYYAAVRHLQPSGSASAPRLPEPTRDRQGGCWRPEVSQVPTRSLTARTGLRSRWSPRMTVPHMLPAAVRSASASTVRVFRGSMQSSSSRCVRFKTIVADDLATLATGRALPPSRTGLPPAGSRQLRLAHTNRLSAILPCYQVCLMAQK